MFKCPLCDAEIKLGVNRSYDGATSTASAVIDITNMRDHLKMHDNTDCQVILSWRGAGME